MRVQSIPSVLDSSFVASVQGKRITAFTMNIEPDHHEYCTGGFSPDDIVISGMSGRFPMCDSIEELKEALFAKKNLIEQNNDRFVKGSIGLPFSSTGTLKSLDKFDAEFFGMTSTSAHRTEPLQRILLEVSYEALIDAGYDPYCDLRGSRIGVYTAISNEDGKTIMEPESFFPNFATGFLRCMLANKCSYNFDFHGPSFTVDSACSSSFVALENAFNAIKEGRVDAALVNSGELCLSPVVTKYYVASGIVSPTCTSNPFDATADGMVRSEAIGAFFVQKASQARRAYATVMEIINASTGFVMEGACVPSFKDEVKLFNDMLRKVKLTPSDIQFVEAHGTGTPVGDPIEVRALDAVFTVGRDEPLLLGSVKSNLGHSEASSSQVGAIKAIIAFETGLIPPNRVFTEPNPACEGIVNGRIKVVSEPMQLTTPYIPINSFGFGGSILQAMLKRNQIEYSKEPEPQDLPRLVLFPATTEDAILSVFEYIKTHPELRDEFFALLNKLSFSPTLLKPFRGYALFQKENTVIHVQSALREKKREIWFVVTGMGCQWPGMGLQMMQIKVFADSMRKSAAVLEPLGINLFEWLRKDAKYLATDRSITPAFVTICAIQIALADVLRALNISPDGIIGHSTGEIICAYIDGCCSLEETVLSAYWRGKCVENAGVPMGAMAAVGLTWEEAKRRCPEGVYPACHNAEDSVTISGLKEPMEKFVAQLEAEKVFARLVNSYSYPFHCECIWPASKTLRTALKDVITNPQPRSERWISTSYPEDEWDTNDCRLVGPEYFVHNLMSVVHFSDVINKIPKDAITIEIGPHFLLQSILKRGIGSEATNIGLMKRNHDDNVGFFLESLGKLYEEGLNPKIENLYRPVKFPVPRGTPVISDLIEWNHSQSWTVPVWKPATTSHSHNFQVDSSDSYLLDHFVDGRSLFPATGYVYLAWEALAKKMQKEIEDINVVIEDFKIHRATLLNPSMTVSFNVNILDSSGRFEIMEGGSVVSTGKVYSVKNVTFCELPPSVDRESTTFVSGEDFYNEFRIRGYEYGPAFRKIVEATFDGREGFVEWNDNWITFLDSLLLFFMFSSQNNSAFVLPTGALSFKINPSLLKKGVEESLRQNQPGIPVNFHASPKICRSKGIEIRSLEWDTAPQHIKPDVCVLENYKFVPYVHNFAPTAKIQSFQKYMIACNKIMDILTNNVHKDFSRGKFSVEQEKYFEVDSYINNFSVKNSLLSTLKNLLNTNSERISPQHIQDISSAFIQGIGKNHENTLLINEYPLRFMFDIISENSFRKLSVLEILNNYTPVLPTVVEIVESCSALKFKSKSLVYRNEEDIDKEKFGECNIQLHSYDALTSIALERSKGIIISAICTSTEEEARKLVRLLSSTVEQKGFILVFHKSCILYPENFLASLSGKTIGTIPQATLESWFDEEGLITVSKISDNACGTLYLLRHTAVPEPLRIINLSENKAWFDELKDSICTGSETVWVVSEDCPTSGIIGMINCLRHEPGGDRIRCVYIPERKKLRHFKLEDSFFKEVLAKDLVMNVYKEDTWGSFRHIRFEKEIQAADVDYSFVNIKKYGDISSIYWSESALKYMSIPDSSLIHIYYSSLNFKDVMLATGRISLTTEKAMLSSDRCVLGLEFTGRNKYGERVAGVCRYRGLSTATESIPELLLKIPDSWSMEEAATVPVVYYTCYYALIVRGRLQPGESILIHSGTGGIGLSAINIALSMNCEIYTTVGTEEKRQYLQKKYPSIKSENIGCSRDITFENMIMKRTRGKGVDVVLNSLADDKFQASIRCVGDNGRFIEIGKYDLSLDHKIGLKFFLRNISFHAVYLDQLMDSMETSGEIRSAVRRVKELVEEGIRKGVVQPLDRTVFQRDEVEKAFRYMGAGTHIGKVLIKIRDEEKEKRCIPKLLRLPAVPVTYFYDHKVYIIVGGLGGFGIEVCNWLLRKGAKNIVLTSRYGARTPYHHLCLKRWENERYRVIVSTRNVGIKEEAVKLLKEATEIGPIGGIFNSAVVLRDSFLENMNSESFKEVCIPKAAATKYLDSLSRCFCPELDHFVCFSSISCGRGNAGQMNYGYANSVMERVCEQRQAAGLPGLSVQWGIIGEVGVVHRHMGDDAMIAGVGAQRVKSCLEVLDLSCQLKHPVVSSYVLKDSSRKGVDRGDALQQLARIFGLKDPAEFNAVRSFGEMGVDSLIGIEVKHFMETTFDMTLTINEIQELRIDDIKMFLEKSEFQNKSDSQNTGLVSTACVSLPKSFVHTTAVQRLNDVQIGTPVFVLDIDSGDLTQLRCLSGVIDSPVFALLLSKEAPASNIQSLASWYLQKMKEITQNGAHVIACSISGVLALEMVLQSKELKNILTLTVVNGSSFLLKAINRDAERSDVDILCDFVENYIPSARSRLKDQLSKSTNFEQRLRHVVDLFTKSSTEAVNKADLSEIITSYVSKLQILEQYQPKDKLNVDLMIIEDSSQLLANDIAEVKLLLSEAFTGKVTIQRVPCIDYFDEESVPRIRAALTSVF